jgi:two-component system chemotaxis response regulator CheB
MAARICEIIDQPMTADNPSPQASDAVERPASDADQASTPNGNLTDLTCPECGGTLWEVDENGVVRFRCHVGHAYSVAALDVSQSDALEAALWGALRSLQERARLFRRLSQHAPEGARRRRYASRAEEAAGHAEALRTVIEAIGREPGASNESSPAGS